LIKKFLLSKVQQESVKIILFFKISTNVTYYDIISPVFYENFFEKFDL